MGFPYSDTESIIQFQCDGQDEWIYVYFTAQPNLTGNDGYAGRGELQTIRTAWIRSDGSRVVDTTSMWQEFGSDYIHFNYDQAVTRNVMAYGQVKFEFNWHRQGHVIFTYSLSGSSDAIAEARAGCRSL